MVLKILLSRICNFLKIFEYFCPSLVLTIITGQRKFLGLADGLNKRTSKTKNCFERFFHCEIRKLSSLILHFSVFYMI